MSDFLITIHGPKATGKTSLLMLLLESMADHGIMTVGDTRSYTRDPRRFLNHSRIANTDTIEQVDISVCPDSMKAHAAAMASFYNPDPDPEGMDTLYDIPEDEEAADFCESHLEIDWMLAEAIGLDGIRQHVRDAADRMVIAMFEKGGGEIAPMRMQVTFG